MDKIWKIRLKLLVQNWRKLYIYIHNDVSVKHNKTVLCLFRGIPQRILNIAE